ncbi:hypothetical protein J6590_074104 [Homalodisca vitripennis]|nr:hypothetical protein J6590_074104 [Homalodisca vitripennis]
MIRTGVIRKEGKERNDWSRKPSRRTTGSGRLDNPLTPRRTFTAPYNAIYRTDCPLQHDRNNTTAGGTALPYTSVCRTGTSLAQPDYRTYFHRVCFGGRYQNISHLQVTAMSPHSSLFTYRVPIYYHRKPQLIVKNTDLGVVPPTIQNVDEYSTS